MPEVADYEPSVPSSPEPSPSPPHQPPHPVVSGQETLADTKVIGDVYRQMPKATPWATADHHWAALAYAQRQLSTPVVNRLDAHWLGYWINLILLSKDEKAHDQALADAPEFLQDQDAVTFLHTWYERIRHVVAQARGQHPLTDTDEEEEERPRRSTRLRRSARHRQDPGPL